jgi:ABC-2 type transport system permease protein
MNIHRAFAITKRIFRGLRHDRRTVALMFLAPIVAMCVFGLAFSGDVEDVKVVVVSQDTEFLIPELNVTVSFSQAIISNFDEDVLRVDYVADVEEGIRRVEDGDAYAVIIFPEHFTESVYMKRQNPSFPGDTTIQVREDRSNVNVANAITKSVTDAILLTAKEAGQDLPMKVDAEDAIYGKGAKFMDFFVPGIMAFVCLGFSPNAHLLVRGAPWKTRSEALAPQRSLRTTPRPAIGLAEPCMVWMEVTPPVRA